MIPVPGTTADTRISYMVSPYHQWFVELGYPELDLLEYDDGEWAIIQYHNTPLVPCLTKWSHVLTKIRNVDKTYGFCKRYAEQLDLEKREYWANEAKLQEKIRLETEAENRRSELKTSLAARSITQNPALMERIAKKGLGEMGLRAISRHIPNHRFRR